MSENRQVYFFDFRIYYPNQHYWGTCIKLWAQDLEDASKIFLAWSSGVKVHPQVASIHIESVHMFASPNKQYYYPSDPELIVHIRKVLAIMEMNAEASNVET